jgi:N-acetyl-anhydromuramyl-L-alanine amidase AmpD
VTLTIDRSRRLTTDQYHGEAQTKDLVVLHHTVGGSAESTFKYWQDDPRRIATAYIVERDGRILEVFPPEAWCNHLGCKDEGLERRSIGIELASEGALTVRRDGGPKGASYTAYAMDGKVKLGSVPILKERGRIAKVEAGWRGYSWFDTYEPAQIASTIALVVHLCQQFGIPAALPTPEECRGPADLRRWFRYQGVLHHAMLRPDKSDLYPGFPFEQLAAALVAAPHEEAA